MLITQPKVRSSIDEIILIVSIILAVNQITELLHHADNVDRILFRTEM